MNKEQIHGKPIFIESAIYGRSASPGVRHFCRVLGRRHRRRCHRRSAFPGVVRWRDGLGLSFDLAVERRGSYGASDRHRSHRLDVGNADRRLRYRRLCRGAAAHQMGRRAFGRGLFPRHGARVPRMGIERGCQRRVAGGVHCYRGIRCGPGGSLHGGRGRHGRHGSGCCGRRRRNGAGPRLFLRCAAAFGTA